MIGRYFEHMKGKPTHERRTHAMQVAGVFAALVFVGWAGSLSLTAGNSLPTADIDPSANSTQSAAVAQSGQAGGNQLVATSSGYSY